MHYINFVVFKTTQKQSKKCLFCLFFKQNRHFLILHMLYDKNSIFLDFFTFLKWNLPYRIFDYKMNPFVFCRRHNAHCNFFTKLGIKCFFPYEI